MSKTDLIDAIEATREEQIRHLQSFVQTPSLNPPGNTTAAATVLTNYLSSLNIPYSIIEPQTGNPNILSEFNGGKRPGPRVVLNENIDVFPVDNNTDGWTCDPWSGDLADGRIHGRGVVDMKSGTASLSLRGSVAFLAVSDEETGGRWGTKYLIAQDKQRWGGDVMLSAEPGQTIRFSERGTLRLSGSVSTRGRPWGIFEPEVKGAIRTATEILGSVVQSVESIEPNPPPEIDSYLKDPEVLAAVDKATGPKTSTIIARPTVNIGTIQGGVKVNMIPDHCTFELDIRLRIRLLAEEVLAVIHSLIKEHPDAKIEIAMQEAASNPASFSTISHPIIEHTNPHYRYAGVPAYVYGCSPLTMAFVNESASVDEFVHVTKVLALATWDFLQHET
ncbi:hypothetical protein BJX70DRAFT_407465 [Aspergillus crustosus]